MTQATHDCTGCPVSAGTHKPADAVHTEIAEPAGETHLRELAAYRTTVDNQEAELSTLRARCAELESERTARMTQNDRMAQRIAELEAKARWVACSHDFDVNTSAGGRGYVAWYFAEVMKRHDFTRYINDRLAADFACALAKHLAAAASPAVPVPQAALAAIATGPCGQCKDSRQPCACQIDTMLKERGLVAVDANHYAKVSARAKATGTPTEGVPADPMDWPLPCDVTVGHGTMRKGVALRTLVLRMKALYQMATGHDADEVAARTPEQKAQLLADFQAHIGATQANQKAAP